MGDSEALFVTASVRTSDALKTETCGDHQALELVKGFQITPDLAKTSKNIKRHIS